MNFWTLLIKDTAHFCIGLLGFSIYVGVVFLIQQGINMLVSWCGRHIPFAKIGQAAHDFWLKVKKEEQ